MEEKSERGGHGLAIVLLAVVLVYFACPFVLMVPLIKVARAIGLPRHQANKVMMPFIPLMLLSEHFEPYGRLLDAEAEVMQKLIGDPFR